MRSLVFMEVAVVLDSKSWLQELLSMGCRFELLPNVLHKMQSECMYLVCCTIKVLKCHKQEIVL